MRTPLAALLVLALLALPLIGASHPGPDGDRRALGDRPATTPAAAERAWQLSLSAPAADGSRAVLASLRAATSIRSGFDDVTPTLVLRYHRGRTSAFITFDTFLGNGTVDTEVTFGGDAPVQQVWALASDGRSAFVPGDGLAFVRRLEHVASFSVRVTPRGHAPLSVAFHPRDTADVIKALLAAGVKYGG